MLYISANLPDNSDIYDILIENEKITLYNAFGDGFVFDINDPHVFKVQLFNRIVIETFKDLFKYAKKNNAYINFDDSDRNFTFQSFSDVSIKDHIFDDNFHISDLDELLQFTIGQEKGSVVDMTIKDILKIVKKNEKEKEY